MPDYFRHETCDALTPIAMRIVGAVRSGDPAEFLAEIAAAEKAGGHGWIPGLVVTLAAMVPDTQSPAALLDWMAA